ncbi:MAG: phospholipase D-like domain-containing protein [Chloroflexota bacterium]
MKPSIRRSQIMLALALLLAGWTAFPHAGAASPDRASNGLVLLTEPQSGEKPLIRAIDAAQQRVFVECYLLSNRRIVRALERAESQGVQVLVLLERKPVGLGTQPARMADELHAAGIGVRWTSSRFALTHAKFMVLDDRVAVISTANFSAAGFHTDRDFVAMDYRLADARQLSNIFRADWDRIHPAFEDPALIVAPVYARGDVDGLILGARRSVDVYAEEVVDATVESLLIARAKQHVRVRVLLPPGASIPAVQLLTGQGVLVRTLNAPYIHAKALIVDHMRGYIGSENLSTQSLDRNREVGIWLGTGGLSTVERRFNADWMRAIPVVGSRVRG